jgi:hypothetical protein
MGNETNPGLLERLRDEPDRHVDMIITVQGDPQEYGPRLRHFNVQVKRAFSLTSKIALGGSARCFIALNDESWVTQIEEDRPIRAMD